MRKLAAACLAALLAAALAPVFAQDYPQRPVRMIAPFAAGGSGDVTARLVADGKVVVEGTQPGVTTPYRPV